MTILSAPAVVTTAQPWSKYNANSCVVTGFCLRCTNFLRAGHPVLTGSSRG